MKVEFGKRGALRVFFLAAVLATFWEIDCSAAMVTMGMDFSFTGTPPASSTQPWSEAVYVDNGDGTVNLTLSNPNLTGTENLSDVYLNFDDSKNVGSLTFTKVGTTGSFSDPSSITLSKNGSKADGDGYYDILISFATGGTTSQTFGVGDSITYKISYTSAIGASDFEFVSAPGGGTGQYYAAAHVQNTPDGGSSSAFIGATAFSQVVVPVPESSSVIPVGLAVALAAGTVLRRQLTLVNSQS